MKLVGEGARWRYGGLIDREGCSSRCFRQPERLGTSRSKLPFCRWPESGNSSCGGSKSLCPPTSHSGRRGALASAGPQAALGPDYSSRGDLRDEMHSAVRPVPTIPVTAQGDLRDLESGTSPARRLVPPRGTQRRAARMESASFIQAHAISSRESLAPSYRASRSRAEQLLVAGKVCRCGARPSRSDPPELNVNWSNQYCALRTSIRVYEKRYSVIRESALCHTHSIYRAAALAVRAVR
jgi:hypothetical protein